MFEGATTCQEGQPDVQTFLNSEDTNISTKFGFTMNGQVK